MDNKKENIKRFVKNPYFIISVVFIALTILIGASNSRPKEQEVSIGEAIEGFLGDIGRSFTEGFSSFRLTDDDKEEIKGVIKDELNAAGEEVDEDEIDRFLSN